MDNSSRRKEPRDESELPPGAGGQKPDKESEHPASEKPRSSLTSIGPKASDMTETDLAADEMGDNNLQGDDQDKVHNQRHAKPDEETETDSVEEGLKRREKGRAEREESGNRKKM